MTGIYADLIANASAWDSGNSDGSVGKDRVINMQIDRFITTQGGDVEAADAFDQADEVQTIATFVPTVTSGNYTLTLNIGGTSVTTANIAYDDNAATIEGTINTVCTGNVAGWTNGDVTVTCTDNMSANTVTLTYDGDSASATNIPIVAITDVDLKGGSTGAVSTSPQGVVPVDEVQELAVHTGPPTGGNFTLTINLSGESAVTTANIAHDSDASTIETAIDTVCTGNIGGWVNGDISVACVDNLTLNVATFTYDGTSVAGADHTELLANDVDLSGGGTTGPGTPSTTTPGVVAVDEIHVIAVFPVTVTSGNYTLTINVAGEAAVTTGNIVFDDNAATIEGIVDTACAGLGGWTNGDITVSGGPLSANAVVLTFDGSSVDEANHTETIINDADLKGGTPATPAVSTSGQTARRALAALTAVGAITSAPPPQGTTSGIVAVSRAANSQLPAPATLKALALQAAIDDSTDGLYVELMEKMGLTYLI